MNRKSNYLLILFSVFFIVSNSHAQDTLKVKNVSLIVIKKVANNGTKTKDTVANIFLLENSKRTFLKQFYLFKNEGTDCNNNFWNVGNIRISKDSLIFTTHHLQKKKDPIIEWSKTIYKVNTKGKLNLVFHKVKKYNEDVWKIENAE